MGLWHDECTHRALRGGVQCRALHPTFHRESHQAGALPARAFSMPKAACVDPAAYFRPRRAACTPAAGRSGSSYRQGLQVRF